MPDYGYDKYGRKILGYKKNKYGGTFPIIDPSDMIDNDFSKDPEYQEAAQFVNEMRPQIEELTKQWLEKTNELHREVIKLDGLDKSTSEALGSYTEKGHQLKVEVKKLREQIDSMEANLKADESFLNSTAKRNHEKELAEWEQSQPILRTRTQETYEGFNLKTGIPDYDKALANGDAYIVEMSPKEYMQRVSYDIFSKIPDNDHATTMRSTLRGVSNELASQYASEMNQGDKFPLPYLDYEGMIYSIPGQEGRHRAVAAYINGYDKIPVLIYKKKRR